MKIRLHKRFQKRISTLRSNEKKRLIERLTLFIEDEFNPLLANHLLHGKYKGYRSINIGGDLRAVYKFLERDEVLFVEIGTHNELYAG